MFDEQLRRIRRERERYARMTPAERIAEAFALGCARIKAYAAAHGVDEAEAYRELQRAKQVGRRYSRVMREIND